MEKRTPHCELSIVRRLVSEGKIRATFAATTSAEALGCDRSGMFAVVLSLTSKDFYKMIIKFAQASAISEAEKATTRTKARARANTEIPACGRNDAPR